MQPDIQTIVFDAYGTLFDVQSVVKRCSELFPGKGEELNSIWRSKQLEYTWLRSLMGRYVDFSQVTCDALVYAGKHLGISLDVISKDQLMQEYSKLEAYPEVQDVLQKLDSFKKVIFSNGTPEMLMPLLEYRGLDSHLNGVLSCDEVKVYKPEPKSYTVVLEKMNVTREQVLFVSSNPWDVAGAKSFGFHVAWVNRVNRKMDELGLQPDIEISDLNGILQYLKN